MARMDNSDYADKSSISGTEGSQYAALVVFKDATVYRPLSKPPVSNTEISPAHTILKTKLPCQDYPPHTKPLVRPLIITRYVAASCNLAGYVSRYINCPNCSHKA
ncbi:hypothetical protein DPMN_015137 [Dreissena polymorpha]|uniref:Uncharacterized protein n=1 Tax=Dreissena polymorpha TaxID=45954 RepID=A0A9D4S458_DREPO|nr:hypothetical protein DPMN_015137 [Dreissena polymorpha]